MTSMMLFLGLFGTFIVLPAFLGTFAGILARTIQMPIIKKRHRNRKLSPREISQARSAFIRPVTAFGSRIIL